MRAGKPFGGGGGGQMGVRTSCKDSLVVGKCRGMSHPCGSWVRVFMGTGAGRRRHTREL